MGAVLALRVLAPLVVTGAAPARAEETAKPRQDHFHDLFTVHLGGLHVADFAVDFTDRGRSFDATLVLESRGLLESFRELRALAQGSGRFTDATAPLKSLQPEGYLRVYRETDKAGVKEVRYTLGRPPEGYNNGEEDPRVPPDLRWGALDPFATFALARRILRTAKPGDRVVLPVFDGKLRYDFQADMGDTQTILVSDVPTRTVPVTLEPIPLSGFSEKHARSWQGKSMVLHFSADGTFTPLKFILNNALGGFVITRVGPCEGAEAPCPIPLPKYLSANNQTDN
ncbi:MAG: DUF3108 domain-containing protein [Rhodospirillum sp.]|nr:DUF3108 domain-containing protein [Rhodospirillum sp.]MCF8490122.1 DUF3108 domain-containing protein [Rhodospirillum sp.]MCF8501585.1 DUF3108 domain-containing protein [Rhodospirillum sp.]